MPPTKLQRWLDLISFLSTRRFPVTVEQLMEGIPSYAGGGGADGTADPASVRRMFERDKDELRAQGIPIETVTFQVDGQEGHGYQLSRRDFYLPYLKLLSGEQRPPPTGAVPTLEIERDDLGLVLDGLRRVAEAPAFPFASAARSALRKLSFDLLPDALPPSAVVYAEPPASEAVGERMDRLADALLRRKRVRFRYLGIARGQATDRDVAPWGLFFQHGHWYLVGHDALRDAVRVFRVSRIETLAVEGGRAHTPDYEIPADFDLSSFTDREAWELGGDDEPVLEARVLFSFPRSLWAARNRLGEQVEERADGAAVRAFRVRQPGPFVRWLLSLDDDVTVLDPPELADELRRVARSVAALYARGSA